MLQIVVYKFALKHKVPTLIKTFCLDISDKIRLCFSFSIAEKEKYLLLLLVVMRVVAVPGNKHIYSLYGITFIIINAVFVYK
jgi:hypothetical protein